MGHVCGAKRGPNRLQPPPVFPNPSQSHQLQKLILILTDKKDYNVYIFTQISSNLKIQICCVNLLRCFFSSRKRFSRPNGPLLPKACYTPKIYASQDCFFSEICHNVSVLLTFRNRDFLSFRSR